MKDIKHKEKISGEQVQLAKFAKALSHPVRVYILELLSKQVCCYSGDLADVLPIARSTLSQHLKELKAAGLILGTTQPPRIQYCLNRENWDKLQDSFKNFLKTSG